MEVAYGISERWACPATYFGRSLQRYRKRSDPQVALRIWPSEMHTKYLLSSESMLSPQLANYHLTKNEMRVDASRRRRQRIMRLDETKVFFFNFAADVNFMAATVKDIIGISGTKKHRAKNNYAFTVTGNGFHGASHATKHEVMTKTKKKNWVLAAKLSRPLKDIKI